MPIKEVFLDAEFVKKHNLCSINSINWARIMVQVGTYNIPTCFDKQNLLYRLYFYFRLCIISIAIFNVDYLLVIQSISLSPLELLETLHVSIVYILNTYPSFIYSWSISHIWNMNSSVWAASNEEKRD